jgi:hypothetical protein
MIKNWKKFTAEKTGYFFIKNCDLGSPNYRRSLQSSKKKIKHFETCKILDFFLYFLVIFALLDPDPDPATQINADPDPQP